MRDFSRKKQPHFQTHETSYSITILLHDAVTGPDLEKLRKALAAEIANINHDDMDRKELRRAEARSRNFEALEKLLHSKRSQSHMLKNLHAIRACKDYFLKFNDELYKMHAFSIMSNHAHLLLDLCPQLAHAELEDLEWPLDRLIGRLKGGSAYAINQTLGRDGKLWMKGYYDWYVRTANHYDWVRKYILQNPVKAGLVDDWREHAGTWAVE